MKIEENYINNVLLNILEYPEMRMPIAHLGKKMGFLSGNENDIVSMNINAEDSQKFIFHARRIFEKGYILSNHTSITKTTARSDCGYRQKDYLELTTLGHEYITERQ